MIYYIIYTFQYVLNYMVVRCKKNPQIDQTTGLLFDGIFLSFIVRSFLSPSPHTTYCCRFGGEGAEDKYMRMI